MWAAAATIAFELLTKSMVFFLMSVLKKLYTHFLMWKKYWNMPKILAKNDEKKISSTFNLFQKLVSLWSHSTIPSKHKSIIFFRYSLLGGEWNFHPFGINFWVTFRPYNSARCHVLHHEVHEIGILASSSDMWDRSQCFYVSRKSQWVLKNVWNSAVFSYDIYTFV